MRALLLHCWTGTPALGWYPAAIETLKSVGYEVIAPALPRTEDPDPVEWEHAILDVAGAPARDLVVIAHSLGTLAALQWLTTHASDESLAAVMLVAPPLSATGIPEVDRFLEPPLDLSRALSRVQSITTVISDEDKYLKPSPAQIAGRLRAFGSQVVQVPRAGHFAPSSGLKKLDAVAPWAQASLRLR